MRNLHAIRPPRPTATFWASADGRQTPFNQLDDAHIRNIVNRFAPIYHTLTEERRAMLIGVMQERNRRRNIVRPIIEPITVAQYA